MLSFVTLSPCLEGNDIKKRFDVILRNSKTSKWSITIYKVVLIVTFGCWQFFCFLHVQLVPHSETQWSNPYRSQVSNLFLMASFGPVSLWLFFTFYSRVRLHCHIVLVTSNKTTRLNLSYIKLLLIHFWMQTNFLIFLQSV